MASNNRKGKHGALSEVHDALAEADAAIHAVRYIQKNFDSIEPDYAVAGLMLQKMVGYALEQVNRASVADFRIGGREGGHA
jgi:hypothetical protein